MNWNLKCRNKIQVVAYRHLSPKRKEKIKMLATMLQILFKLGVIFSFAFMIACSVFIVICVIRGDIKISITRTENEKKNE